MKKSEAGVGILKFNKTSQIGYDYAVNGILKSVEVQHMLDTSK